MMVSLQFHCKSNELQLIKRPVMLDKIKKYKNYRLFRANFIVSFSCLYQIKQKQKKRQLISISME